MIELEVQTVQMYRTSDGKLHLTEQVAKEHILGSDFKEWYYDPEAIDRGLHVLRTGRVDSNALLAWLKNNRDSVIRFLS